MTYQIYNPDARPNEITDSLFLMEPRGLFDSIHRPHEELHNLYKNLKRLDWDELEFDLQRCRNELNSIPTHIVEKLIATIAWQWEADSVAAHNLVPLMAPFVTNSELWTAYVRIGDNENLHALSYSEIVKYGFENPSQVFLEIQANKEAFARLKNVAEVLGEIQRVGAQLTLGIIDRSEKVARKAAILAVCVFFILERIQFMGSFSVTFAIGEMGVLMPIVDTVQKILTDEFTVHIAVGRYVIKHELTIPESIEVYEEIKPLLDSLITEVVNAELAWNKKLFANNEELPGLNQTMADQWVKFAETDVRTTLGIPNKDGIEVTTNPLPYMARWVDINKNQGAVQEKRGGNYLLGGIVNSTTVDTFDLDGL